MSKFTKAMITICVFTVIILYFIKVGNNDIVINGNTECERLNEILKVRVQEFFEDKLPTEDGMIVSYPIADMISEGNLTSKDLSEVGTSCNGNVFVSYGNSKYYYSYDVTCGSCYIGDLYNEWSEYADSLPDLNTFAQIQTNKYYNYSDASLKYTEWTNWITNEDTEIKPTIPVGVQISDTETEQKTQYSYRDGSFKWYKLSGGTSYYGSGTYSPTSPGSGYTADTSTKKIYKTTSTYTNKSELQSAVSGYETAEILTTTGYQTREAKYRYIKSSTTSSCTDYYKSCTKTIPMYKCYYQTATGYNYVCSSTSSYSQSCYTSDYNTAYNACVNAGYSNCNVTSCTSESGGTYKYTMTFTMINPYNTSGMYDCTVSCNYGTYYATNGMAASCSMSKTSGKMSVYECLYSSGSVSYNKCTYSVDGHTSPVYWLTTKCSGSFGANGNVCITGFPDYNYYGESCVATRSTVSGGTTTTTYGYNYTYSNQYSSTSGCGSDTIISSTPTGTTNVYQSGGPYTSCTNSSYPNKEYVSDSSSTSTTTSCTGCSSCTNTSQCMTTVTNPVTQYISSRSGATSTNSSDAVYLTDTEYANTGRTGFVKDTSSVKYTDYASVQEGTCPNNTETSTCKHSTMYYAKIYQYKWYKTNTASKTWYNNGEYLSFNPGGYTADTSSAKWGDWSDYTDEKITESTTKQVRTRIMKRLRFSYVESSSLKLKNFLPLEEFQTTVGKTLEELSLDSSIKIQTKAVYRYRTMKE